MSEKVLTFTVEGAIAFITLSRPEQLNAFNKALRSELLAAAREAENNDQVRVIVLAGEGRSFCAGADLGEPADRPVNEQLLEEYAPFLEAIAHSRKIWIASVGGAAAGIGAALACNCDYVFMADDAYMYLAFAAIGLVPDGAATWHLLHAMGYRKAFETIVEGRKISAEECLSVGLANAVVEASKLKQYTIDRANKIAQGAPLAQASAKQILRQVGRMSMHEAIEIEAEHQLDLTHSEDFSNAVKAFFAKKKPVFTGR